MRRDVLSLILGWTMVALIVPLLFSFCITWWLDGFNTAAVAFAIPTILSGVIGVSLLSFGVRSDTTERLRDREAFAAVALAYPVAVLIGALPFWLGGVFHGPFTDGSTMVDIGRGFVNSWFEAMSGFTTTGATVIQHSMSPNCIPGTTPDCINAQPKGILLWRSLTQWLGGMGIIMLGLMLLSRVLGGGMALARAELTGPSLSRLRPKLQQTAMALWTIYLVLTIAEIVLLWGIGGMNLFDSVNHGLTTLPSGGFSTHDESIGYYDSVLIDTIVIVFMFIAGINFTLIWFAWEKQWDKIFKDEEAKYYIIIIVVSTSFILLSLFIQGHALDRDILHSIFTVIAIGTSTGFTTNDYMAWPVTTHVVLFLLMIIGGSAGSTAGGLKVMRVSLAFKMAWREIGRIVQPKRIMRVRMNGEVIERDKLSLVVGMLFIWTALFAISCIILTIMLPDSDFESIMSLIASSLGNTGPALGDYGPTNTWASIGTPSLIFTSILMWFGRLELMTALLLLHPRTWAREEREAPDRASVKLIRELFEKMEEKLEEKETD